MCVAGHLDARQERSVHIHHNYEQIHLYCSLTVLSGRLWPLSRKRREVADEAAGTERNIYGPLVLKRPAGHTRHGCKP